MKPIYKPSGKAKEYGDFAVNIYTGCNHGCDYCFAPSVLRRDREKFHTEVESRKNIVEEVKKQLEREKIKGQIIHLCFTCDPYPAPPVDTAPTREIIKAIKDSGNHVQILTKGGCLAERDFDLLDSGDWFGVTLTGAPDKELSAADQVERYATIKKAHDQEIKTWVSFEPVYSPEMVYEYIEYSAAIDRFKIGKLNYHPSDINWGEFGRECERLCKEHGQDYYIKDSLRKEMEKDNQNERI